MRVAVLFSGGKDSTFATFVSLNQGWDVKYLVTMLPAREDSWMFHHPCVELTKLQAEAMGIKHITRTTSGEKEKELEDLIAALKGISGDVDAVVSGAVASRYQKDRVDAVCKELGLRSIAPLWGKDQLKLLQDEVDAGFEIIITAVAAEGFDESWLGRKIDYDAIKDLEQLNKKFGVNPVGEGGEYESIVLSGPFFKQRIQISGIKKIWDEKTGSGYIICENAKLIPKRLADRAYKKDNSTP